MKSIIQVEEAEQFIRISYGELGKSNEMIEARVKEIKHLIRVQGYYTHTFEELEYGAKLAWRNSNRCIGRLFWNMLTVLDARKLDSEEEVYEAILQHLAYATNGGRIRPTVTVFKAATDMAKQIRIVNHQLIRYAGYETEQGIKGDPHSIPFTQFCQELGWEGRGGDYDVLPIVIQIGDREPRLFDLPEASVLEVPITHPEIEGFDELNLHWYAVPAVSDMVMDIGGIQYTAAPFNGYYMGTEIGARNLADVERYNMLPKVASIMGLDRKRESTLWRDKALVELNVAVLHSYQKLNVTIVDHHTAAKQLQGFERNELSQGRAVTGNWKWLIPPVSPATTHIFHQRYDNTTNKPNFFHRGAVDKR